MPDNDVRKRWSLDIWMNRIEIIEEQVIAATNGKKVSSDIENVFFRNYARLSLCLREMITLLDNGYPDGALTIARTAYEITVLTEFLYLEYSKGESQELIERYFEDHNVKAYRNLLALNKGIVALPQTPVGWKTAVDELENKLSIIKEKYKKIEKEYWWASIKFDGTPPSFNKIAQCVDKDIFVQALYKRACISVHASSMGSFALLGRNNADGNLIYTTQTDEGFEAPLLLGMTSHERVADVICDYWKLNKGELLNDMTTTYETYFKQLFQQK